MSIVQSARTVFESVSGLHVYRGLPHGTNVASDIKRVFPEYVVANVVDVGANVGQSARKFRKYFPQAKISCVEPVSTTFKELESATRALGNVECFNVALGDVNGTQSMVLTGPSLTFHVVRDGEVPEPGATETVQIQRLDDFCSTQKLSSIGYLKIDAEGFDLRVLAGGEGLIQAGAIDFIQVEAGMNSGLGGHVSFNDLFSWLTSRGYALFGIYDQSQTWPHGQIMRRADIVFVSQRRVTKR